MKHIFYFIGILFIVYELGWLFKPKYYMSLLHKYENIDHKDSESFFHIALPQAFTTLWVYLGLLTFNGLLFLGLLTFNWVLFNVVKPLLTPGGELVMHWVNSLVGVVFTIFVIVNSYYIKFDVVEYLVSRFFG